jgi:hypothetical protein
MSQLIDAKGLGPAQPVVLARDALDVYDEITIVVDERRALENLELLGMHQGYLDTRVACLVDVTGGPGDIYWVRLRKPRSDGENRVSGLTGPLTIDKEE